MLNENIRLFILGGGIGLICALIGALVNYLLVRKRKGEQESGLPGCLLLVTGGLGIAGLGAIGISYLFNGTIWPAMILGAGVVIGFFFGFTILFVTVLFISNRRTDFLE